MQDPDWSPTINKVVYWAFEETDDQIYVVRAVAGAQRTKLSTFADRRWDRHPSYSPDGEKIVYEATSVSPNFDTRLDIWVMNANGTNKTNITKSPTDSPYYREPDWGPARRAL